MNNRRSTRGRWLARAAAVLAAAAVALACAVVPLSAAAEDATDEDTLTNSIASTTRTVAQDGSTLTATAVDGVDNYEVSSKTGLTVTYSNTMDMTVLAASFLSTIQSYYPNITDAWTALQTFYYWITDDTVIYLTYQFNDAVDLSALTSDDLATLASQITLTSDMFTFSQSASDLSVDTSKNALVITCHWNSTNAAEAIAANNELDPTITITGITLDLVADWGTTTGEDGTTTKNDSLTVVANGNVAGTMYAKVTVGAFTLYDGSATIDGGTATDTFSLVLPRVDVTVTKVWDDNDGADGLRPDAVTVELYADGVATGLTAELTAASDWAATFEDLPAYAFDASGEEIAYTVVETAQAGYETSYSDVAGSVEDGWSIEVTNSLITVDVTVSKVWDDDDDEDGIRPDSVTIELYADGEATGKTVELSEDNGWTDTFEKLVAYAYDDDGNLVEVSYSVEEVAVEGYDAALTGVSFTQGSLSVTITNTHTVTVVEDEEGTDDTEDDEAVTVTISVEKAWGDDNDAEGLRPESVTIELYANGVATGEVVVLSAASGWAATFEGLDACDEDGEAIAYAIREVDVPDGYAVTYSAFTYSLEEGTYSITVTNTLVEEAEEDAETESTDDADTEDTDDAESTDSTESTSDTTTSVPSTGDATGTGYVALAAIAGVAAVAGALALRRRALR